VIASIGALGALALTATMARREGVAVVLVGSTAVSLIALWRISAVALALIPAVELTADNLIRTASRCSRCIPRPVIRCWAALALAEKRSAGD
jgi:hypothetical protein